MEQVLANQLLVHKILLHLDDDDICVCGKVSQLWAKLCIPFVKYRSLTSESLSDLSANLKALTPLQAEITQKLVIRGKVSHEDLANNDLSGILEWLDSHGRQILSLTFSSFTFELNHILGDAEFSTLGKIMKGLPSLKEFCVLGQFNMSTKGEATPLRELTPAKIMSSVVSLALGLSNKQSGRIHSDHELNRMFAKAITQTFPNVESWSFNCNKDALKILGEDSEPQHHDMASYHIIDRMFKCTPFEFSRLTAIHFECGDLTRVGDALYRLAICGSIIKQIQSLAISNLRPRLQSARPVLEPLTRILKKLGSSKSFVKLTIGIKQEDEEDNWFKLTLPPLPDLGSLTSTFAFVGGGSPPHIFKMGAVDVSTILYFNSNIKQIESMPHLNNFLCGSLMPPVAVEV